MTGQELAGTDQHAASAALKERVALSSTAASAGITGDRWPCSRKPPTHWSIQLPRS